MLCALKDSGEHINCKGICGLVFPAKSNCSHGQDKHSHNTAYQRTAKPVRCTVEASGCRHQRSRNLQRTSNFSMPSGLCKDLRSDRQRNRIKNPKANRRWLSLYRTATAMPACTTHAWDESTSDGMALGFDPDGDGGRHRSGTRKRTGYFDLI